MAVIAGVLAAHGFPSIATRFVSRYRRAGGAPLLRAFARNAQKDMFVLALAAAAMVAAGALTWPGLDGRNQNSPRHLPRGMIPFVGCFAFTARLQPLLGPLPSPTCLTFA
jgi:O-antigen/teichoic acid export membrane protein